MHLRSFRIVIPLLLLVCVAGCAGRQQDAVPGQAARTEGNYFSVRQLAADQFRNYRGTPFVIEKIISLNGARDSVVINSYSADWESVLQVFFATDIGEEKFIDGYQVDVFNDGMGALVLFYAAKDENLFTRSLQVRLDAVSHRVLSVFIETGKKSFWNEETQKLYYTPMKLIQIQEYSKPLIGRGKDLHVIWRFIL
jgi:hypothetical protein